MSKFLKTVSTFTFYCVLMTMTSTSEAAIVNYNFNGAIDSGSLAGETYNGSFAYDNTTRTNSGQESIDLTSLSFNFLSSSYSLADADSPPTADFLSGIFLGVTYSVSIADPMFSLVSGSPEYMAYFSYDPVSGDSGFGSFNVAVVPIPCAIWLFGSGLGLLTLTRRRTNQW